MLDATDEKHVTADVVKSLVEPGVFAVLAALTVEGDVVLRPISGSWGSGIVVRYAKRRKGILGARCGCLSRIIVIGRYITKI